MMTITAATFYLILVCFKASLSAELSLKPRPRNFVLAVCQAGAEKALKAEVARNQPELRSAFSRPGLVTFKSPDEVDSNFALQSVFARAYSASIGSAVALEDIIFIADAVLEENSSSHLSGKTKLRLHVYGRDEPGVASEHPLAILAAKERVSAVYESLQELGASKGLWLPPAPSGLTINGPHYPSANKAESGELVLDVVVPTGPAVSDPFYIGQHLHSQHHSPWPGGYPNISLPEDAPSRAYLKIEETILWSSAPFAAGDVVVEAGSAPGGATLALLRRGCSVVGIDPSPPDRRHAPVVALHPKFRHIKSRLAGVSPSQLPAHVDWLLCDANVAPQVVLPSLALLTKAFQSSLKGVVINLKLGEGNWGEADALSEFLRSIEAMGMMTVRAKQLPSHRQEVVAVGLTKKGKGLSSDRG
eukprot:gene6079-12264_t